MGLAGLAAVILTIHPATSPQAAPKASPGVELGPSGLPVPRFVSLKASRVNVRVGPGEDYKIAWVFVKPGLPIEVVQEYDNWRKVRDADGTTGWIFQSLLSGKRTAVVAPWAGGDPRPIHASATPGSAITAYLEPGVTGSVERCSAGFCRIAGKGFSGWIDREQLWGVYPDEDIE
ncbi:SH3 domain-containing protein [Bauldia sp.]|uniref:SH3 domain-containing protein n=1 Tax=Bauldia sp. TaxID=2575872 RepID=UPI0025C2959E|nr:SH3 domain-containing protein [Bauldia sp.]